MHPELVIICDDIRVHIKDGKLLTITIGNAKPFDYQQISPLYKSFIEAEAYEDQVGYFDEWSEATNELKNILSHFKRYNTEENGNPLLNSICCSLSQKNADELISYLGKNFLKP